MRKFLAVLGTAAILTSCASTGGRLNRISPAMSRAEVVNILGKPQSAGGRGDVEVLHYKDDHGFWQYSYYYVRIVDGKVESYGPESHDSPVTDSNPPVKK